MNIRQPTEFVNLVPCCLDIGLWAGGTHFGKLSSTSFHL